LLFSYANLKKLKILDIINYKVNREEKGRIEMISVIYIIDGYTPVFMSYEEALKFIKWYNVEFIDCDYIDPSEIKQRYLYETADEAMRKGR